jgi:hypothetical protein
MEKSQNILARDCQRYTQFFIFERNFAKIFISFLMFLILKNKNILQNSLIFKFANK